jgi:hypothetical protein
VLLPFVDIDDLHDDDYTLRLIDYTGTRYDLTMLGKAYGQILADISKRRNDLLQHDLLLTGVDLQDTYPGRQLGAQDPMPVEVRLFEDLLAVVPERGTMWGLPYSFIDDVRFDPELFQTHIRADDGSEYVFGMLGLRSEEFPDELRRLLDALAARTARTLSQLLPGLGPHQLSQLAGQMRDGRAVQQGVVDGIDRSLWPRLEHVVVGTEDLRSSYGRLAALCPPGWGAFGVKSVQQPNHSNEAQEEREEPEPQEDEDEDEANDRPAAIMWFFTPLSRGGRPLNLVAHEITSEKGHATYLYRLMEQSRFDSLSGVAGDALAEEVKAGIGRLNRALLTLNFRREPIYLPQDQIESGRFARYRVALRKLDYLRWAREAFVTRLIHSETWDRQLEESMNRA